MLRGPRHLVGGDLLAVARASHHNTQAARVRDDARGGRQAEGRVVVQRVVLTGAVVDHLMPPFRESSREELLGLEAGVVRPRWIRIRFSTSSGTAASADRGVRMTAPRTLAQRYGPSSRPGRPLRSASDLSCAYRR